MAYQVNKTDGTLLVDLIDGIIDTSTTDLSLVGRNYKGYGESFNENFVKLLENFSNPNEPVSPIQGQLWYDTSENKLKIYDGTVFQSAAGSYISNLQPSGAIQGDTWYDTTKNQFYLYSGLEWTLIGPSYTKNQGQTGVFADTIFDSGLRGRTVLKLFINNSLQAVISAGTDFNPNPLPGNIISELVTESNPAGTIKRGVNILPSTSDTIDDFKFRGTSLNSENLVSAVGEIIPESRLLKNDENGVIQGSLELQSSQGLTVGVNGETTHVIENGYTIRNTRANQDFNIVVNSSGGVLTSLSQSNALTIKSNTQRVGIFNGNPSYNLDVTGDVRVTGNLTVEGDSVTTNVETVEVEDKNIVLGNVTTPTDLTAADGGITLKGATDKTFNWVNGSDSWTSSENIDLANNKSYKINNVNILSQTTIASSVVNSNLQNLGTLTQLNVDTTRIDGSTLSRSSGTGFTINVGGDIDVSASKITNLLTPTAGADATNKTYVDTQNLTQRIIFGLDTTGWASTTNDQIILLLTNLYPVAQVNNGKQARVACTFYGNQTTDPINISGSTVVSTVDVEPVGGAGSPVTVVQGITLPNSLTTAVTLVVSRETRAFIVANGVWTVDASPSP